MEEKNNNKKIHKMQNIAKIKLNPIKTQININSCWTNTNCNGVTSWRETGSLLLMAEKGILWKCD